MMLLSIQGITKQFDDKPALKSINFDVAEGEIVSLLGPSGCGKTTLLRIIAGLEMPDIGQVLFKGKDIGPVPPHRRDFGLMFQDYALFPHKNVFDNVAFGLRMRRKAKAEARVEDKIGERVREMLVLVGLQGFERRSVNELSGGEAQRVALARSLAPRPHLLMLDEPLGSLDRTLRERLMTELREILKDVGVTALYVTHDQAEAFAIADRAVVMNAGHAEQIAPPEEIYRCPATPFVARFLGLTNLAEGRVIDRGRIDSAWGEMAATTNDHQPGDRAVVLIRPEAATLNVAKPPTISPTNHTNTLRGQLLARSFRGGRYRVQIQPEIGPPLTFELITASVLPITPGDLVTITLDPAGVVLLPAQ